MPSPSGQTLGRWHGQGGHVPTVWSHHQRHGRDHWDQQGDPTVSDDHRDDTSLHWKVGGRTQLHPVQDEIDDANILLGQVHLKVHAAQSKVTEVARRVSEAMEEMAKIRSLKDAGFQSADR